MGIIGSLIGGIGGAFLAPFTGGGSILIGAGIGNEIEDTRNAKKANAQKMGLYNQQMALAQQQFQFQQDYAKNRLQWQVEDAKKAGLHPMVAAGLSPTSFSPVSTPSIPDMSSVASDLGQNLDYAVMKAKTQKQQAEALAFMRESNILELQGKHLDNELKQMEIMSMLSKLTNSGPASPDATGSGLGLIGGQQDALMSPEPMKVTPHLEPGKEPGINPSVGWLQNSDWSVVAVMSDQAKQRLEEDVLGTALWNIRNRVTPHVKTMFGRSVQEHTPPKSLLPKGAVRWEYAGYGEYVPVDSKGNRVLPPR